MLNTIKKAIALLLLLVFNAACAQQTAFLSEPQGALVSIDGQVVGETPCRFDYQAGTGGKREISIEKEGYEAIRYEVKVDEVDQGARKKWLAAGLVWSPLWLGTLFTKKLNESYEFILKKMPASVTADAGTSEGKPL